MRARLGAGLLLLSTMLVGVAATPAEAAAGCDDPDTTWTGTPSGSLSWADEANWTNEVPTADSVVCIPETGGGPEVPEQFEAAADVIDAAGATVTVTGTLQIGTTFDVWAIEGDHGTISGGTTSVTHSLRGSGLTFRGAVINLTGDDADLGGELAVWDGSRLNVSGAVTLAPGAWIDSLDGLLTITGSLTFDAADSHANVSGGFANHGLVNVTAGSLIMMGAEPEDAHPDQFSTGRFVGDPDVGLLSVAHTELRDGARLDGVQADHITVPDRHTVTAADSRLVDVDDGPEDPVGPSSFTGGGELVVTDGTLLGARVGGSLRVKVPAGQVASIAGAFRDQAQLEVRGVAEQTGDLYLDDQAVLDVWGTHRMADGVDGLVDFTGEDPGLELIRPGGLLSGGQNGGLVLVAPFQNSGIVDSAAGQIHIGPRAASGFSQGTFRAGTNDSLLLGSNVVGDPPFDLGPSVIEGPVDVCGNVTAESATVRGTLKTVQGGRLVLDGMTTMTDDSSIAGDVTVDQLLADLGPEGTASLAGVEVTDAVIADSGTLSVPSLGPATLAADGTLARGIWVVESGATLDLPAVTTNDARLLLGPGASFGDGLATLTDNGPNGTLGLLGGAHVAVSGALRNQGDVMLLPGSSLGVGAMFRNQGDVMLHPGSRLDVGAKFRQLATGWLGTRVDATGRGRVRAAGPRDLGGVLSIDRDPEYTPPVGAVLNFITSDGRQGADDAFDRVVSPKYGARKLRVDYGVDHVRLRVDRVG